MLAVTLTDRQPAAMYGSGRVMAKAVLIQQSLERRNPVSDVSPENRITKTRWERILGKDGMTFNQR